MMLEKASILICHLNNSWIDHVLNFLKKKHIFQWLKLLRAFFFFFFLVLKSNGKDGKDYDVLKVQLSWGTKCSNWTYYDLMVF